MVNTTNKREFKIESDDSASTDLEPEFCLFGDTGQPQTDAKSLLQLLHKNKKIGSVFVQPLEDGPGYRFYYNLHKDYTSESFLHPLIIRSVLSKMTLRNPENDLTLSFQKGSHPELEKHFHRIGFKPSGSSLRFSRNAEDVLRIQNLKSSLRPHINASNAIGRGYYVDSTNYDARALDLLLQEYSGFLWGGSEIAFHKKIAPDERIILEKHARGEKGLEVGCGSGRITIPLSRNFEQLIATDYVEEIIQKNQKKFASHAGLNFLQDDIRKSRFESNLFDVVMFWENGIGTLLKEEGQAQALSEMTRVLRPGGKLILSVRCLPRSPIGHLMVTPQDSDIMGIVCTFSKDYLNSLVPSDLTLIDFRIGESRPAGGHALFFVYTK